MEDLLGVSQRRELAAHSDRDPTYWPSDPCYARYQYLTPTARPLLGDNSTSRASDYDRQRRQYLRHKTMKGYRNIGSGLSCNIDTHNVNVGTGWDECYPAKPPVRPYHVHAAGHLPRHDYPGRHIPRYPLDDPFDGPSHSHLAPHGSRVAHYRRPPHDASTYACDPCAPPAFTGGYDAPCASSYTRRY
eukprot:TRINITY_DN48581_c0_g1_i1.p1 TRINITY_DN48581_c0_g1~~TRINITY_DN48581_c0_g1_i1.p1  ORF type:complete len:207 (-),score=2.64 TRINITY_DN48581_c0_g1_i1:145-708(-)